MRVILTNDVPTLGTIGHVVNVKDGYARNFLIPRSLAVVANESNQKELDHRKKVLARKREKLLAEVKAKAQQIEQLTLTVSKQVGEDERIFGSVTSAELAVLLNQEKIQVSKKDIVVPDDVKKVGVYTIAVKLHSEVTANLKVWVVAQQS